MKQVGKKKDIKQVENQNDEEFITGKEFMEKYSPEKYFVTTDELAQFLSVSKATIIRHIKAGTIKSRQLMARGRHRICVTEVGRLSKDAKESRDLIVGLHDWAIRKEKECQKKSEATN